MGEVKTVSSASLIIFVLILCFPLWDKITQLIGPIFTFKQGCPLAGHDKQALVEWETAYDPGMVCSAQGETLLGDPTPGLMYYEEEVMGVGSMTETVGNFWL